MIEISDVVDTRQLGRCVVLSVHKDFSWRSRPNMARIRRVAALNQIGHEDPPQYSLSMKKLTLIRKGPGKVTPGVSYEFTKKELRDRRWAAYRERLAAVDQRCEGWSNSATLMARIYLSQEPDFHSWLEQNRRRDGTISADKVAKWFIDARLMLDESVFKSPIEPPAEFANRPHGYEPCVNWDEIAESFSAKAMGLAQSCK